MALSAVCERAGQDAMQPEVPAHSLPEELLITIARLLSFEDLLCCTRVCLNWRNALNHCAALWSRLDMIPMQNRALLMLPLLLPRTGLAPTELAVKLTDTATLDDVRDLCAAIAPHLCHIRTLAVHLRLHSHYGPVFELLRTPAPILQSLDICTHAGERFLDDEPPDLKLQSDILVVAPRLAHVNWGPHVLPPVLNRLADVTSLRVQNPHHNTLCSIFTMFPRMTTLCLENCWSLRFGIERLPEGHPLAHLELRVPANHESPFQLIWAWLDARNLRAIPLITTQNYGLPAALSLIQRHDGCSGGTLRELRIDHDDRVDAVFRHAADGRARRMLGMYARPRLGQHWNVRRLLHEVTWLDQLASLTVSLAVTDGRPMLPAGTLPALTTLSVLCGRPETVSPHGLQPRTLFDDGALDGNDVLDAPALCELRLVAREGCGDVTWISPSALHRFITNHLRVDSSEDGSLLGSLLVDEPAVQLDRRASVEETGYSTLRAEVRILGSLP